MIVFSEPRIVTVAASRVAKRSGHAVATMCATLGVSPLGSIVDGGANFDVTLSTLTGGAGLKLSHRARGAVSQIKRHDYQVERGF
jgi:hypothetical protein